ncbi:MAG: alpha/beta hydrolase [Chloroflexota bacterium]
MENPIRFETVKTNGINLQTALAGPKHGELVILLHGFPEAWFGWEAQMLRLAKAGFRVAAPDQRGYNLSEKPKGVGSYQMSVLAEDMIGLADGLGAERFYLAGHDFGAMVSWTMAMRYPERIKRMVIANVPHPLVMQEFLRSNFSQIKKSWYMLFFQIPWLPERLVRADNWQFLIRSLPKRLSDEARERYRTAWEQPGAIKAMINWYRASLRSMGKSELSPQIKVPTLILWGKRDPHLSYEMAPLSLEYCSDGRLVTFEDATHWVLHDKPEEVSQLIIEHFS